MSGTFFGFNTALKGLFAQQKAMNTTTHNIANADTPGYTRQQAVMEATPAFPVPSMNRPGGAGQVGTGVNVNEIRRIRDVFLDTQIRKELASLGQWEQRSESLKLVETIFIEPSDDGLSSIFNEFWKTWQELSKNAENIPIRTSLVETSVSLAEALKHAHGQLSSIVADLEYIAGIKATQINTLAQQIDDLNQQIATIQLAGDSPNDLKDKRDLLLDELAKLVDFTTEDTVVDRPGRGTDSDGNPIYVKVPDGQIRVKIGDTYLVHVNEQDENENPLPGNISQIRYDKDNNVFEITDAQGTASKLTCSNGELLGLIEVKSQVLEYIGDLNDLASNLADKINEKHVEGFGIDENSTNGIEFFIITDPDNAASSIHVNPDIVEDVRKIAASDDPDGGHDGNIARQIAQHRPSIDRQYDQLVSRIGVKTNEARRRTDGQEVLLGQLEERKEGISGVSLDEEMAMMLQFQRIYQASATMINTLDEMVQTILSMKR